MLDSPEQRPPGRALLGGSFNPPHIGHLRLAIEVREALGTLVDSLVLVPCGNPPHKRADSLLPFALRAEMTRAAVRGLPGISVSEEEGERQGYSYTWDTLSRYREKLPGRELYFVIGTPDFALLHTWHRGLELPRLCQFIVVARGEELLVGVTILAKALGVTKSYVGIENNKPDAIAHLGKLAASFAGVEIVPLRVKYPQGGEKQLIAAVTGRQVPSGGLPIDVGAVVQNASTALAVYEAVQKNKPLIERVVTVTGKKVKTPSNFLVRIGTPIDKLIEAVGGLPADARKVINGGPMMGRAMVNLSAPVTKGTSGILVMSGEEAERREATQCIKCAKCVDACPMGLEPFLISKLSRKQIWDRLEEEHVTDCIECGCCQFTCPAAMPLLDYIRLGKAKVMGMIRARAAAQKK